MEQSESYRLVIADDHPLFRGALRESISGLLERVVSNLVANALRHSPVGAPPLVTGSGIGDRVELRVIDRGPGIPVADFDRVFAPFQRLGSADRGERRRRSRCR